MKIDRSEFQKRLLAVSPGLTSSKDPVQGDCIIAKAGRFYTFNGEVACSIVSGLPNDLKFAVKADALTGLMKKLTEAEIELTHTGGQLILQGKGRTFKLNTEADIFLPVDSVERPKEWSKLSEGWSEAIDLVVRCTDRKSDDFARKCVHVHPQWLEASDNLKMARWVIDTFVSAPVLVRGITLAEVVPLGVTKGCETESWLHFHNPFGLRVSVRKWALEEAYPELDEFLNVRGERVVFPKGVAEAAARAGLLLDEKDGSVKLALSENHLTVSSSGIIGEAEEHKDVVYSGRELSFLIPPKLIAELVETHTECEVSEVALRIDGGSYLYLTSLEMQPAG